MKMPITVNKSPHVQFTDSSSKLLETIVARLESQSEQVKAVHVLANFSVDADTTHKLQQGPIAHGLVVAVKKGYKLSDQDMAWFHPNIARGRSVFAVDQPLSRTQLTAANFDGRVGSVGEYTIARPDEFGCEQVEHRLVVDVAEEAMLLPLYKKWLQQGATAGDIDKQWKRMKFGDTYSVTRKAESARLAFAKTIVPNARQVSTDTVNAVLSDTEHVYFTNNAILSGPGDILVKTSALAGYRAYGVTAQEKTFYPASLGIAPQYYAWDDMAPRNCARVEQTCSWGGALTFNTQVMQPPAISGAAIRSVEDEYALTHRDTLAMRLGHFSPSDAFVDNMAAMDIYKLSPAPEHTKAAQDFITAPLQMDHPVMQNLIAQMAHLQETCPDFHVFNPKFVDGNRFKIPRKVYKQIA